MSEKRQYHQLVKVEIAGSTGVTAEDLFEIARFYFKACDHEERQTFAFADLPPAARRLSERRLKFGRVPLDAADTDCFAGIGNKGAVPYIWVRVSFWRTEEEHNKVVAELNSAYSAQSSA